MTATDPTEEQTARRPMSYAGAADTGPCEGRHASPSNPTGAGKARTKEPLTETFVFRCSAGDKVNLMEVEHIPVSVTVGKTNSRLNLL